MQLKKGSKTIIFVVSFASISLVFLMIEIKLSNGRLYFQQAVDKLKSSGGWHYVMHLRNTAYGPKEMGAKVMKGTLEEWVLQENLWRIKEKATIQQMSPKESTGNKNAVIFKQIGSSVGYGDKCLVSFNKGKYQKMTCESLLFPHIFKFILPVLSDEYKKNIFFYLPRYKHVGKKDFLVFIGTIKDTKPGNLNKRRYLEVWVNRKNKLIEKVVYSSFTSDKACCTFTLISANRKWTHKFFYVERFQ